MKPPLVSVVCLCYNHERFLKEAIESVLHQSYSVLEIIIVDDASTDNSQAVIRQIVSEHPEIKFLPLQGNLGNCAAFNRGLSLATGEFIVDFATDDVMMPERIQRQVEVFQRLDESYGVVFTDAAYIDKNGKVLYQHYHRLRKKGLISEVPQGDIFEEVLRRYFICGPTMLVRKKVFDYLGGYDTSLAYEDFDFWVRSARKFRYAFIDSVLTKVRKHSGSLSTKLYRKGDLQLYSTYKVLSKVRDMVLTSEERKTLTKRVRYEHRHAVMTGRREEGTLLFRLLRDINGVDTLSRIVQTASLFKLPLSMFRKVYLRIRYGLK